MRWLWIAAGVAVFAFVAWGKRSLFSGASSAVVRFANAVAKAEGFNVPGSIGDRAHNPGNLKLGGKTLNGITVFENDDDGWAALYRQLGSIVSGSSSFYSLNMTIRQMGNVWAPSGDNNVPGAWAQNVAAALGVTVDTPLRAVLS